MNRTKSRNSGFLAMALPPLVVIVVVAAGVFVYYRLYGTSTSQYDNAMSNCVRNRTLLSNSSADKEAATVSCAREIPGGAQ